MVFAEEISKHLRSYFTDHYVHVLPRWHCRQSCWYMYC